MKKLVFTFGRMNPPTIGHEKLAKKIKEVARKENANPMGVERSRFMRPAVRGSGRKSKITKAHVWLKRERQGESRADGESCRR